MISLKKIVLFCIFFILLFSNLAINNIFETIDWQNLVSMEQKNERLTFYLRDINVPNEEHLNFLHSLSSQFKVSIIKNEVNNHIADKIMIVNFETFPFEEFYLEKDDFEGQYFSFTNFKIENNPENREILPFFNKNNKLRYYDMNTYFLNALSRIDGIYTLISNENYDKLSVLKNLENFYQIDSEELTKQTVFETKEILNLSLIVYIGAILLLVILMCILLTFLPITQLKEFGVKKILGHDNRSIFFDYIKNNFILLVLFILFFVSYNLISRKYFPVGYLKALLANYYIILVIFVLVNMVVYSIISHYSINNMLKRFFPIKKVLLSLYLWKVLSIIGISFVFMQLNGLNTELKNLTNESKNWDSYGEYIVLDNYLLSDNFQNDFMIGKNHLRDRIFQMFETLEKMNQDVYYVRSQVFDDSRMLGRELLEQGLELEKSYEFMSMNRNYLKVLEQEDKIEINEFSGNLSSKNTLLIPNTLNISKDKLKKDIQLLLYSQMSSEEQSLVEVDRIEVNIVDYTLKEPMFTFSNIQKSYFNNPIIHVMTAQNLLYADKMFLSNTGIENPIKFKFNDEEIHLLDQYSDENINLKFTNIKKYYRDIIEYDKNFSLAVYGVLSIIYLLSLLSSVLLIVAFVKMKWQRISVFRLLGFSMIDRYGFEFLMFGLLYLLQMLIIILLTFDVQIILLLLSMVLTDAIVLIMTIKNQEKESIASLLKGASQ